MLIKNELNIRCIIIVGTYKVYIGISINVERIFSRTFFYRCTLPSIYLKLLTASPTYLGVCLIQCSFFFLSITPIDSVNSIPDVSSALFSKPKLIFSYLHSSYLQCIYLRILDFQPICESYTIII